MAHSTPWHRVPSLYSLDPLIVDDFGNLVETEWEALGRYLNDQYESIPAAREALGGPIGDPMPYLAG